jgi:hypothetical protein
MQNAERRHPAMITGSERRGRAADLILSALP